MESISCLSFKSVKLVIKTRLSLALLFALSGYLIVPFWRGPRGRLNI
jgi:hypothetical protein